MWTCGALPTDSQEKMIVVLDQCSWSMSPVSPNNAGTLLHESFLKHGQHWWFECHWKHNEYSAIFHFCDCILFNGVCSPSPFTPSSWNGLNCTSVSCKNKNVAPSILSFIYFFFFFLLKCTHEFSEHCIKFIKNHLILRLQKWMQKKCYLYFSLREKKTCLRKVVYTCNVFFYFP